MTLSGEACWNRALAKENSGISLFVETFLKVEDKAN